MPIGVFDGESGSFFTKLFTVAIMSSVDPPSGVSTLIRSPIISPFFTSTSAPLIPVPPMSIPIAIFLAMSFLSIRGV